MVTSHRELPVRTLHYQLLLNSRPSGYRWNGLVCGTLLAIASLAGPMVTRAEEPYQRFLDKLRQEQLFDLALIYVEDLEKSPNVSAKFKQDIALERAMLLYQSGAILPPRSPSRIERLDAAEVALGQFLEQKKDHPRRGEARLKLGELLLTRADEAQTAVGVTQEDIPDAVRFYDQAHQLFENTIRELAGILEQIKGNRISLSDSEMVAYRQQVQQDARQAQLLSANSVERRGRSRGMANPQRLSDLEQAVQMYSDLYAKDQGGLRHYALFYRSGVHAELGKVDDAIDGYQRIADLEGNNLEILRPLQTEAITRLVQLFAGQQKFELGVERAELWLKNLRPEERAWREVLELQLQVAKLKIAWAEYLQKQSTDDRLATRLIRDVRPELRGLLRVPGPHLDTARELLAKLGVETTERESSEIPKIKNLAEGIAEAQKRLDEAESDALGMEVLRSTLADSSQEPEALAAAQSELETLQAAVTANREAALQLLRDGMQLLGADIDRSQLFEARFRTAFLLLKLDRPWDALVVGEFLARGNPGTETGLRAAAVTLASFSELLNAAGDDKSEIMESLGPFAEYLVATWPQSPEAAASASALAQLSMVAKEWDKAERFLGLVPDDNPSIAKQRRDLGLTFYSAYLQEMQSAQGVETDASRNFRQRSIKWLELGLKNIAIADYDGPLVDTINALARLQILEGNVANAAQWLLSEPNGLVKVLENKPELAQPKTAMDTLRTAIQVVTAQLVDGSIEQDAAVAQLQTYIQRMQATAQATPEGAELLTGISVALARDLKDNLSATKEVGQRTRLTEALLLVIGEAAKSESFATQYWAGNTKISLAEDLAEQKSSQAAATMAFSEGAAILQAILEKESQQAGWIQPPEAKIQIRVALAKALRGTGDFQNATLRLGDVLDENNALLDVQIEAAETLQAWGKQDPKFYRSAIMGGRKKGGQNVIWGWGKIAQMTTNQPTFVDQFYNARYQLALARFRYATTLATPDEKLVETRRAEKDILSTASLYPELGGAARKKSYDALLKEIQQALGKPTTGLE